MNTKNLPTEPVIAGNRPFREVALEVLSILQRQGTRCLLSSTIPDSMCAYGNSQGHHCAVGWLLPFDRPELMGFEGSVEILLRQVWDLGPNDEWMREHAEDLELLQELHDKWPSERTPSLHSLWKRIAKRLSLQSEAAFMLENMS